MAVTNRGIVRKRQEQSSVGGVSRHSTAAAAGGGSGGSGEVGLPSHHEKKGLIFFQSTKLAVRENLNGVSNKDD
jgi:hypothetical protein